MRRAVLFLALAVMGCSKQTPNEPEAGGTGQPVSVDVQEAAENGAAPPNIAPTALAGVAMTYAYRFRLPAQQVAATQEKHAVQCEALGPARCRITGMEYHAGRNRTIQAELSFKLAPEVARRFGKQGIDTVVGVGGMLEDAKIDSSDEGVTVAAAQRDQASLSAEQKDLAAQLAKPGLGASERSQLQARQASLRDSQRVSAASQADALLKLASTPMTFSYGSGQVDPGLNDGPWIGAIKDGWANIMSVLPVLLTLLISLVPWVTFIALLVWLWRRFAHRIGLSPKDGS